MNWTYKIPKINGWYWTRYIDDRIDMTILRYEFLANSFLVYNDGSDGVNEILYSQIGASEVEWYGPIEPPE